MVEDKKGWKPLSQVAQFPSPGLHLYRNGHILTETAQAEKGTAPYVTVTKPLAK